MTETAVKVLVVDDEPSLVDVITMTLRYEGFDVAAAGTGQQALAQVEAFRPDLMLPDMEGFEVARRLGARVPIVYLTARDATADKILTLRRHRAGPVAVFVLHSNDLTANIAGRRLAPWTGSGHPARPTSSPPSPNRGGSERRSPSRAA